MRAEINGQPVDLKGAKAPSEIAEVLRQHLISVGADPATMQALHTEDSDDSGMITLSATFGIREEIA